MVSTTISGTWGSLFNDPFFIGFDKTVNRLNSLYTTTTNTQTYPPYNIEKLGDDEYLLTLAVAGFSRDDISVTVDNGALIIKGEIKDKETESEFLHRGIAGRKFTRTFALGEYMEVIGAEMKDGMLTVAIDRIVPEEKKPKSIKIR